MKTSNKILLGIFLVIILLTTTVQVMVYAKYKRGEYVPFQRDKIVKKASIKVPATHFVSIKNLGNCVLVNSDTSRFEVDEDNAGNISYRVVNDTLIIRGDTTLTPDQLARGERNSHLIKIFVPAAIPVNATSCTIYIDGAVDSVHAPSYNIQLSKGSDLYIREKTRNPGVAYYFNRLLINSELSNISLDDHVSVNDLNVTLALNSRMKNNEATIRSMVLEIDSYSSITLSGNSIKALK
jgi:hypothetical protein